MSTTYLDLIALILRNSEVDVSPSDDDVRIKGNWSDPVAYSEMIFRLSAFAHGIVKLERRLESAPRMALKMVQVASKKPTKASAPVRGDPVSRRDTICAYVLSIKRLWILL